MSSFEQRTAKSKSFCAKDKAPVPVVVAAKSEKSTIGTVASKIVDLIKGK